MLTSDFDYDLPQKYIAQTPIVPRDAAKLMVINRKNDDIRHEFFRDITGYLEEGDVLVLNETRVIPARLSARKIPGGGKVEILLLHREDDYHWEALVGGKGLTVGKYVQILGNQELEVGPQAQIIAVLDGPRRRIRFTEPIDDRLNQIGHTPLPPYIHTPLMDGERYQTVYARRPGSAAAPTAGFHFTPELIAGLITQGIRFAYVTLHIGLDTFAPVTEEQPLDHKIHTEWCSLDHEAAHLINNTRRMGGRIVAVGTTSVRTVESAALSAHAGEAVGVYEGSTSLYILPGYTFKAVDAMITNFHLPRSTLIMLVSAFAGRERILNAYEVAKREGYRFYSFGDAMLIM